MTRAVTTPDGQQLYAPDFGHHGPKLPMRECNRCGEEIVWIKSDKTGRYFPAQVIRTGDHQARKYVPWQPHRCRERQS